MIRLIKIQTFADSSIRFLAVDEMAIGWIGRVADFKALKIACSSYDLDLLPLGYWLIMTEFIDDDKPDDSDVPETLHKRRHYYIGPSARHVLQQCFSIPASVK